MSIALMTDVWRMDIAPTDKIVLLALADAANDDGVTWMALESKEGVKLDLMKKTSLSRRAIQSALKRLCDAGYLSRVDRPGKGVIWTVKGCTSCAPQQMRPAGDAPGGAARAPKPSTNPLDTSEANASSVACAENDNKPSEEGSSSGELVLTGDPVVGKPKRPSARPQRFVPEDWRPSPAHIAKAESLGVDLAQQVEMFRNHEYAKPKTDFDRAFHTWLQNAAGRFADRPRTPQRGGPGGWNALDQAVEGFDWDHSENAA